MRVLVTGGTGFIGRCLVRRLAASHEVFCLVRDPARLPPGAVPITTDLVGPLASLPIPNGLDALVHLAQSPRYREFPSAASELFAVNVAATARLLEVGRSAAVTRFILASTGSVHDVLRATAGLETGAAPPSFYAATKLAAETLLWPYSSHFRTCILRLYSPYGPGQTDRLVADLIDRVRRGTRVVLAGACDVKLSPTYVEDIADVFVAALERGWTGCLDVAAPHITSIKEIAEEIGRQLGVAPLFERVDRGVPYTLPDLAALGRQYDVSKFRTFSEGLAAVLAGGG